MASSELVAGGGVGLSVLAGLGVKAINAWRDRARWIAELEAARAERDEVRAAHDALLDAIPSLVAAEVARVVSEQGGAWRTQTGTAMPSTAALERMMDERIEARVAHAVRHSDAEQNAKIEGLAELVRMANGLLRDALGRSQP